MKQTVRRILSLVLCAALLCLLLPACGQQTLHVLVDIRSAPGVMGTFQDGTIDQYLQVALKAQFPKMEVTVEVLPEDGADRQAALTNVRASIMAGEGPDVFLVGSSGGQELNEDGSQNVPLFLMPEKSMELGLFLPLDEYIEKAQYMEWDKMNATIMAAGRSEQYGQVLLPMAYNFVVSSFPEGQVDDTPSPTLTWDNVVQGGNAPLEMAGAMQYVVTGVPSDQMICAFTDLFGDTADYTAKKLTFTEEELFQRVVEYTDLAWKYDPLEEESYPGRNPTVQAEHPELVLERSYTGEKETIPHYAGRVCRGFDHGLFRAALGMAGSEEPADVKMVPLYNDDGGVTAQVHVFAAINANTKHPDEAFQVVDYLLSEDMQATNLMYYRLFDQGEVPVYDELMTEEKPLEAGSSWYMSEKTYAEFAQARDCITAVNLYGTIEQELGNLAREFMRLRKGWDDGSPEGLVHEYYSRMEQELGE